MSHTYKVAILSPLWPAMFHRIVRGALTYADTHPRIAMKAFRLPRGFGSSSPILKSAQRWKPDGVLCFLTQAELDRLLKIFSPPPPVVNTSHSLTRPGVTVVTGLFSAQAEKAVRHLRQQGLRTMALALTEGVSRLQAFRNDFDRIAHPGNLAQAFIVEEIPPGLLDNPTSSVKPVPKRLAAWLRALPKPAGVFCPSIGGGGYLIRACHTLGLRVPEDISVVGGDDADFCLACEPTMTSVLPSGEQIGHEAMRQLDRMMRGDPHLAESVRIKTVDLHVRESTGLRNVTRCDIAAALGHIEQHACRGLTVGQLIEATQKVSKVTFHKHFLIATGQSPGRAILERRMSEARRLLAETHLSITLVAEYCGFGSSNDFARSFLRIESQSPSDYRARHSRLRSSHSAFG